MNTKEELKIAFDEYQNGTFIKNKWEDNDQRINKTGIKKGAGLKN